VPIVALLRVTLDSVQLHALWRETDTRLDSLARSVREGKCVDEASNFCRWLRFSGVLQLLEQNPKPFPLVVNGTELRRKVEDVLFDCGEHYKHGKGKLPLPRYEESDMASVMARLDLISKRLDQISPPSSKTADAVSASLHVIQGGVL